MTETLLDERTEQDIETSNEKPESAHYVMSPNPEESNHAYLMRAIVEGFPVTAICGYTWQPGGKSASNLPHCQECKSIYDALPDDGGGLPHE